MNVQCVTLDNGAKLWTCPSQNRDVYTSLWIPYGENNEPPKAHFIEHMTDRSTRKRKAIDIKRASAGRGIGDGALTYQDRMNFWMMSPSDHAKTGIEILYETFANDLFNPEEVELERNVVLGEYLGRVSNPSERIHIKVKQALGFAEETEQGIRTVTPADLSKAKQKYFGGKHLSIGIAGGISDDVVQVINNTFGQLPPIGGDIHTFSQDGIDGTTESEEIDGISGYVDIGFLVPGIKHDDMYPLDFITHMLGGTRDEYGHGHRLHERIRDSGGLAYTLGAEYARYMGMGYLTLYAGDMEKGDVNRTAEIMLEELERVKEEDITEEEFERVRANLLVAERRDKHEGIEKVAKWLSLAGFYGIPWELEYFEQQINTLSPRGIREVAKRWLNRPYTIKFIPRE